MAASQGLDLTARSAAITAALNLTGNGLEYGPLDKPILSKSKFSVSYVDYADRMFLIDRYRDNTNRTVSLIPETDIVTEGRLISEFLPENSIDYVVASHTLEHVPDLLGWLEANLRVLKPRGRIALAFPDKRYCFDLARNTSTRSDILAAYLEKRTRPSFPQICDQIWNARQVTAADVWAGKVTPESAPFTHSRDQAIKFLRAVASSQSYHDCHCWVFADYQFVAAINELRPYCSTAFDIVAFTATQPGTLEFYITFEKSPRPD